MEILEYKIKNFLAIDVGYVSNSGRGYGKGKGDGYGNGDGRGAGFGYGNGKGSSCGYGYGTSNGNSNGNSFGNGSGTGCGSGSNNNKGYGGGEGGGVCNRYGKGYGDGDNTGLKEINGKKVYMVDDTSTIFTSVRGNVAQGFIVQGDLRLKPCFIVKENNKFAHGNTLRDAFTSLQEKLYDDSTEEERIEAFKKKFPDYDEKYDNKDLFTYHHVLTGSCRMGREEFVKGKGLSLDGKTSVREFVELTKDAYGSYIIKELPKAYGIE